MTGAERCLFIFNAFKIIKQLTSQFWLGQIVQAFWSRVSRECVSLQSSASPVAGTALLGSWASILFRTCGHAASEVASQGPSCSMVCGSLPDQGSNLCPLYWQAVSYPQCHSGKSRTEKMVIKKLFSCIKWQENGRIRSVKSMESGSTFTKLCSKFIWVRKRLSPLATRATRSHGFLRCCDLHGKLSSAEFTPDASCWE